MATYDFSRSNYGGFKKNTTTVSKTIKQFQKILSSRSTNGASSSDGSNFGIVELKHQDSVYLGSSPSKSLLKNIWILVHEAFDTGVTMNLYHSNVYPEGSLSTIKNGIVLDKNVSVIEVDMAIDAGVVASDGVTAANKGVIWTGNNVHMFAAILSGGADITKGKVEILYEYMQFDEDFKTERLVD